MHRDILLACLPYLTGILGLLVCQGILLRCSRARLQWSQLRCLHRDQRGAVQSLSFVLTLPVFLFIMMFIVQLALITMARISVEYAAYAAARSAVVWFPANLGYPMLGENQVGAGGLAPVRWYESGGRHYVVYRIAPGDAKYERIRLAAAMACMPISPSTRVPGVATNDIHMAVLPAIERTYHLLAPSASSNTRIPARLRNKLAYALANTHVEIEVHHCGDQIVGGDPPLYPELYLPPYEIGWQDQIFVTVYHRYALLPGPGRLLSRRADSPTVSDAVWSEIDTSSGIYTRLLWATARMGNEGQKPSGTIPSSVPGHRETYIHPLTWNY